MPDGIFEILRYVFAAAIGFSSGAVISGAVFAFISVIGVVPHLAQKTRTTGYAKFYETALTLGGIFGTIAGFASIRLPASGIIAVALSLCIGIFFGALAMSLAEVLDAFPILMRRARISRGIFFFVIAIALGKLAGSLLYFLVPGFFDAGSM